MVPGKGYPQTVKGSLSMYEDCISGDDRLYYLADQRQWINYGISSMPEKILKTGNLFIGRFHRGSQ